MQRNEPEIQRLAPAESFQANLGISRTTLWRWRKYGWIVTVQIAGRHYISDCELARFHRRAASGEFSTSHLKTEAEQV